MNAWLHVCVLVDREQNGGHETDHAAALQPGYDSSRRRQLVVDDVAQLVHGPA